VWIIVLFYSILRLIPYNLFLLCKFLLCYILYISVLSNILWLYTNSVLLFLFSACRCSGSILRREANYSPSNFESQKLLQNSMLWKSTCFYIVAFVHWNIMFIESCMYISVLVFPRTDIYIHDSINIMFQCTKATM
jgi:hypothetical protein